MICDVIEMILDIIYVFDVKEMIFDTGIDDIWQFCLYLMLVILFDIIDDIWRYWWYLTLLINFFIIRYWWYLTLLMIFDVIDDIWRISINYNCCFGIAFSLEVNTLYILIFLYFLIINKTGFMNSFALKPCLSKLGICPSI